MAEKQKGAGPQLNKARWTWSMESGWPVVTADFSKVPQSAPEGEFRLEAEDQSPIAIAERNLRHIGIFHYGEKLTTPRGEIYDRNTIETEGAKLHISGSTNVRLLRVWAHSHNPKLDKLLDRAQREFAARHYDHHKNHAQWSAHIQEDGAAVITADFAHIKGGEQHYFNAAGNMRAFGKLKNDEDNAVTYDEHTLTITIVGEDNCRIFGNWIAKDDPPLAERFMKEGIWSKLSPDGGNEGLHAKRFGRKNRYDPSGDLFSDIRNTREDRGR